MLHRTSWQSWANSCRSLFKSDSVLLRSPNWRRITLRGKPALTCQRQAIFSREPLLRRVKAAGEVRVPAGGSIPCWKQRTKGHWLVAARLRWVLDAFYVTLFLTYHSPVRRRCLTFRSREWRRLNREFAPAARFSESGAFSILSFRIRDCKVVSRGSPSSADSFLLDAAWASF